MDCSNFVVQRIWQSALIATGTSMGFVLPIYLSLSHPPHLIPFSTSILHTPYHPPSLHTSSLHTLPSTSISPHPSLHPIPPHPFLHPILPLPSLPIHPFSPLLYSPLIIFSLSLSLLSFTAGSSLSTHISSTKPLCPWPARNSPVFTSLNAIMERCNDLMELVQTILHFRWVDS